MPRIHEEGNRFEILVAGDLKRFGEHFSFVIRNGELGGLACELAGLHLHLHGGAVALQHLLVVHDVGDEEVCGLLIGAEPDGIDREVRLLSGVKGVRAAVVDAVGEHHHRPDVAVGVEQADVIEQRGEVRGFVGEVYFAILVVGYGKVNILITDQIGVHIVLLPKVIQDFPQLLGIFGGVPVGVFAGGDGLAVVDGENDDGFVGLLADHFEHGREQQEGEQRHGHAAQGGHDDAGAFLEGDVVVAEVEKQRITDA